MFNVNVILLIYLFCFCVKIGVSFSFTVIQFNKLLLNWVGPLPPSFNNNLKVWVVSWQLITDSIHRYYLTLYNNCKNYITLLSAICKLAMRNGKWYIWFLFFIYIIVAGIGLGWIATLVLHLNTQFMPFIGNYISFNKCRLLFLN